LLIKTQYKWLSASKIELTYKTDKQEAKKYQLEQDDFRGAQLVTGTIF
jgi:hypothetical protein